MARKKKGSAIEALVAIGILIVLLLASIPRTIWTLLGIAIAILLTLYVVGRIAKAFTAKRAQRHAEPARAQEEGCRNEKTFEWESSDLSKTDAVSHASLQQVVPSPIFEVSSRISQDVATTPFMHLRDSQPRVVAVAPEPFSVPAKTNPKVSMVEKKSHQGPWIGPGESVSVAGVDLPGGMIYVGSSLYDATGNIDPCLIDPSLSVAVYASYTERDMDYWPRYATISPVARRAYLSWLAGGRNDPLANIGYVFLFFYGLERRLIRDEAQVNSVERAQIETEVRRLLEIYGDSSHSFRRYANELIDWSSLSVYSSEIYKDPVPEFPRTMELPLYVRLALGQTALERVPVPLHLALAWARLDPNISLRTPAIRCSREFDAMFAQIYREAFRQGLQLPKNRSKLKLVYKPASAGFMGQTITLRFGETPDVTALTDPIKKLRDVVEAATKTIEPYSRFIGRNPETEGTLQALLHLPLSLWPDHLKQAIATLKSRVSTSMVAISLLELQDMLGAQTMLTRERMLTFAKGLESMNIGIEPDILAGAKVPKAKDQVVLFSLPIGEPVPSSDPHYKAAVLTLQLAASVAVADGQFSPAEVAILRRQVHSWAHLSEGHRQRLMAHLRLLILAPVSLASLKRKLEPLGRDAKKTLAGFMTTVAAADGSVSPKEIRLLESVYKALDVDPTHVFSDVHAVIARVEDQAARNLANAALPPKSAAVIASSSKPVDSGSLSTDVQVSPGQSGELVIAIAGDGPVAITTSASLPEQEWAIPKVTEAVFVQTSDALISPAAHQRPPAPSSSPAPSNVGRAPVSAGIRIDPVRLAAARAESDRLSALWGEVERESEREQVSLAAEVIHPSTAALTPSELSSIKLSATVPPSGFQLDYGKIAAGRKESEALSALLAGIFQDEPPPEDVVLPQVKSIEQDTSVDDSQSRIMGLDAAHTAFARMLLSRPQWTRGELTDLAADLELMLDGALETVNDAAFEGHDEPFTEGEDPIEVNTKLLEMIES